MRILPVGQVQFDGVIASASEAIERRARVPDAAQRFPGDANGSRECAPDDRLRIVQCGAPQSRDQCKAMDPRSAAQRAGRVARCAASGEHGLGVAIYGRPNLPLCAPLQPASPVLVAVYVEVGATVRADIAMAVMLLVRLSDVVFRRQRKRLRRRRNGRRGIGLRRRREWRRHGHRDRLIGNNRKCAGHFRLYAAK